MWANLGIPGMPCQSSSGRDWQMPLMAAPSALGCPTLGWQNRQKLPNLWHPSWPVEQLMCLLLSLGWQIPCSRYCTKYCWHCCNTEQSFPAYGLPQRNMISGELVWYIHEHSYQTTIDLCLSLLAWSSSCIQSHSTNYLQGTTYTLLACFSELLFVL